jgi:hypothetical protein
VRDSINLLKKAGSVDLLSEQQQWIWQHVDDPAKMLANINKSNQEDSLEPEVESNSSDIEVVVSDDKLDGLGDKESSDLEDFIASSSSSSDNDREDDVSDDDEEDNVSNDREYSYKEHDESYKDSGDDEEAELSA